MNKNLILIGTLLLAIAGGVGVWYVQKPSVPDDVVNTENTGEQVQNTDDDNQDEEIDDETVTSNPSSFTMVEVATHNSASSCWTVVNGSVYDLTSFISKHPGGQQAILSLCGRDGTSAFTSQHGGQSRPESELASLKIGILAK